MRPVLLALVLLAALPAAAPAASPRVVDGVTWLCRPGIADNPCTFPLSARSVTADGSSRAVRPTAERRPKVDCFYVYPTVSQQPTPTADPTRVTADERGVATMQASRFHQRCRMFAPIYPQVTLGGLLSGGFSEQNLDRAYAGVRRAWRSYLRRDNRGRGFVLIGHSQGSGMLNRLIAEEVDGKASVRRRLVAAYLLGGTVAVPKGKDVGGDFKRVPACRSRTQTGCVVSYATFLTTPPESTLFGRVRGANAANLRALCVNPAALRGGEAPLRAYLRDGLAPDAGWVTYPGLYRGRCTTDGRSTWLQISIAPPAGPSDARERVAETIGPSWGLHLYDVNLGLGDLVDLLGSQARSFAR